jgi:hypothetical protein
MQSSNSRLPFVIPENGNSNMSYPLELKAGDRLSFRKLYMRHKYGDYAIVTALEEGGWHDIIRVDLITSNGIKLQWALRLVAYAFERAPIENHTI